MANYCAGFVPVLTNVPGLKRSKKDEYRQRNVLMKSLIVTVRRRLLKSLLEEKRVRATAPVGLMLYLLQVRLVLICQKKFLAQYPQAVVMVWDLLLQLSSQLIRILLTMWWL